MSALRTTALHGVHRELGATLVDFGGWDMPLWYPSGAVAEHLAVLRGAGLFDIGHMDGFLVRGVRALEALQYAFTKDLARTGRRAAYGAFLNDDGSVLDDAVVYPLAASTPAGGERFFVVVNAGRGRLVLDSLVADNPGGEPVFEALRGSYAKLDLQGPASASILGRLLASPDAVFADLPYFTFKGDIDFASTDVFLRDGTPLFLSRTGYTGELGFELFVPEAEVGKVWSALLEAGSPEGLLPCGLAARDSLRAGALLPLSQQDIGPWPFINNPWPFTLPRDKDGNWTKAFKGREALDPACAPHTAAFCGFDPRKVGHHARVELEGRTIGEVLTCVADMGIGRVGDTVYSIASPDKPEQFRPKGLICGFVRTECPLAPGTEVTLCDERRSVKVLIAADIRPARTARMPLN